MINPKYRLGWRDCLKLNSERGIDFSKIKASPEHPEFRPPMTSDEVTKLLKSLSK